MKENEEESGDELIHFQYPTNQTGKESILSEDEKVDKSRKESVISSKSSENNKEEKKPPKIPEEIKLNIKQDEEIDYSKEDPDINFILEPIKREESIKDYKSCQSLPKLSISQRVMPFRFPINSSEFENYFSQITPNSEYTNYKNYTDFLKEDKSLGYMMDQSNLSLATNADLIRV